jgi:hypothetical protein
MIATSREKFSPLKSLVAARWASGAVRPSNTLEVLVKALKGRVRLPELH